MNRRARAQWKKDKRSAARDSLRKRAPAFASHADIAAGFRALAADAADVVLTDADPYADLKGAPPGRYRIIDEVRGTVEDVIVNADGTHVVSSSRPLDVEAAKPPTATETGRGSPSATAAAEAMPMSPKDITAIVVSYSRDGVVRADIVGATVKANQAGDVVARALGQRYAMQASRRVGMVAVFHGRIREISDHRISGEQDMWSLIERHRDQLWHVRREESEAEGKA